MNVLADQTSRDRWMLAHWERVLNRLALNNRQILSTVPIIEGKA